MKRNRASRLAFSPLLLILSLACQASAQDPTSSTPPSSTGDPAPKIGWQSEGCYTDSVQGRSLSVGMGVAGAMTNAKCKDACRAAGFILAGTEYAGECYCDNQIRNSGKPAPDGETGCNMACNGNATEMCGGPDRLTFWKFYTGTETSTSSTAASATPDPTASPSASASTTSQSSAAPAPTGLPTGFEYKGCYVDGPGFRILNNQQPDDQSMTIASCASRCAQAGYEIAAMEYSYQCFCDNAVSIASIFCSQLLIRTDPHGRQTC